jgi:type IV pilus assembly protein PilB
MEQLALELWEEIIISAISKDATDISLSPMLYEFKIIFRIKGKNVEITRFPKKLYNFITASVKKISNMNNEPFPERCRTKIDLNSCENPLWINSFPTLLGEKVNINLQYSSNLRVCKEDLDCLGFNTEELKDVKNMLGKQTGLVFICGPIGSGKSSTVRSFIMYLLKSSKDPLDIHTLEFPVDYIIDGINQTEIDPSGKMDTYNALKSLRFQKPDVICMSSDIEEVRTIKAIVGMAIFGQMLILQYHASDISSALFEFNTIGIKPYLLSIAFGGAISQRLARTICNDCKKKTRIRPELFHRIQDYTSILQKTDYSYYGAGCDSCNGTGFGKRIAIYEVIPGTEKVIDIINHSHDSPEDIRKKLNDSGYTSLRENAIKKAIEGVISLEEAIRCSWL